MFRVLAGGLDETKFSIMSYIAVQSTATVFSYVLWLLMKQKQ